MAKLNADKRPVNLSIEDLPKVPHKGIDAVWAHNGSYTVTEAKTRGSIFVLEGTAAKRAPKELKTLSEKSLYLLLSTSAEEEGDAKTLVQMSKAWTKHRAKAEAIADDAQLALFNDICDRRVILVTFESEGAVEHAQALSEMELGVPTHEALAHVKHGPQRTWLKADIDRIARVKQYRLRSKTAVPNKPTKPK